MNHRNRLSRFSGHSTHTVTNSETSMKTNALIMSCSVLLLCSKGTSLSGPAINQVDYFAGLTGTKIINFDALTSAPAPGINIDGVLTLNGVSCAEKFAGQTVSVVDLGFSGTLDALSGNPTSPLTLQPGDPNKNLSAFFSTLGSSTGICGEGPFGFPSFDALGEGALAFLFDFDQSEFGIQMLGANGGTLNLDFFARNGSLIQSFALTSISSSYLGFTRDAGIKDIAGVSIYNGDNGGVIFDNLKFDVAPGICRVTTLNDSGPGSLREAINCANANPGLDNIIFDVAGTINVLSELPAINDNSGGTVVDGATAPGYSGDPVVELRGPGTSSFTGIKIRSADNAIRALAITAFRTGIYVDGAAAVNNTIGGLARSRNVVFENEFGIIVAASNNRIEGNFIGTDLAGISARQNGWGMQIAGDGNVVGGTSVEARNVISGNRLGIHIGGSPNPAGNKIIGNFIGTDVSGSSALGNWQAGGIQIASVATANEIGGEMPGAGNLISANYIGIFILEASTGNRIQGNLIGTDVTGTSALGNVQAGVWGASSGNLIGGSLASSRNVISGNTSGIILGGGVNDTVTHNVLERNLIGTDVTGEHALGNRYQGVFIASASMDTISKNVIAFNGFAGPAADGILMIDNTSLQNLISENSVFSNSGLGIDVEPDGVTSNDLNDGDPGPNQRQNFPVLSAAVNSAGSITVQGSLNNNPNGLFTLEFFSDVTCDPSGNGEGRWFLGAAQVATDASGNADFNVTFSATIPDGYVITTTTTDSANNTSEFSRCFTLTPPCTITCPPSLIVGTGSGATQCGSVVNYSAPATVGSCGTVTCTPPSGSFFPLGTTMVICTAGAGPSCSFTVTVVDDTPPVVSCPATTTLSANASCQATLPNLGPGVTASDNCTLQGSLTKTQSPAAGTVVGLGSHVITVTVTDAAGNSAICTTTVIVADTTPPQITSCSAAQNAVANGICRAPVPDFTAGVVASDCNGPLTITQSPAAGTPAGLGSTTVTLMVKDPANNTATCTTVFTVIDNSAPMVTCPAGTTASADAACQASIPDVLGGVSASDNCDSSVSLSQSPAAGTLVGLGTHTIAVMSTDDAGNSSTCTTALTVVDTMAPVAVCPAGTTVSADGACQASIPDVLGGVSASDNCDGSVSLSQSPAAGTVVGLGEHLITVTAADDAGNSSTCTTTLTVNNPSPNPGTVTLRVVDQFGEEIAGSAIRVPGQGLVLAGSPVALTPGSFNFEVVPKYLNTDPFAVEGLFLSRIEPRTITACTTALEFVWPVVDVTLRVVDQHGAPVVGLSGQPSTLAFSGSEGWYSHGTVVRLPITDESAFPGAQLGGHHADGYNMGVAPAILDIDNSTGFWMTRNEFFAEVNQTTTDITFEWIVRDVQLNLVDQHGAPIVGLNGQPSTLGFSGSPARYESGTVVRLPATEGSEYPRFIQLLGHFAGGYDMGLAPAILDIDNYGGFWLTRNEFTANVTSTSTDITFEWVVRDVQLNLVDQHGAPIVGLNGQPSTLGFSGSHARYESGTVVRLPATEPSEYPRFIQLLGHFADGYDMSLAPAILDIDNYGGFWLTRNEFTANVTSTSTDITFEWVVRDVQLNLVDQNGAPIVGQNGQPSTLGFSGSPARYESGTVVHLPTTEGSEYPRFIQLLGHFAFGYDMSLAPAILDIDNYGGFWLTRNEFTANVTSTSTDLTFEWVVRDVQLKLVDQNGAYIVGRNGQASVIQISGSQMGFENGSAVRLPTTDPTEYTRFIQLLGHHAGGYDLALYPGFLDYLERGRFLDRREFLGNVRSDSSELTYQWTVISGCLQLVDLNERLLSDGQYRFIGSGITFTGGNRLDLPTTDEAVYPRFIQLLGFFAPGYQVVLRPDSSSAFSSTLFFELLEDGTFTPSFVSVNGVQVGLRFTQNTAPTSITCPGPLSADASSACTAPVPEVLSGVALSGGCGGVASLTQEPAAGTLVSLGTHTITVTATDQAGNTASCTTTLTVLDTTPPTVSCLTATAASAGADCQAPVPDLASSLTASDNCTPANALVVAQTPAPGTLVELGEHTITLTVTDGAGTSSDCTTTFVVENSPPDITGIAGPSGPEALGATSSLTIDFTDPDTNQDLGLSVSWDDGTTDTVSAVTGVQTLTLTHTYGGPGVYTVEVTVTDPCGSSVTTTYEFIVIYDPTGGFVTGGGWINSPPGAYAADPTLSGKATFGFVSKYLKGATTPTGNTEFQFQTAGFRFKSTAYEWLVVAGAKAQYKGEGTVNGSGTFKFLLTATDGQAPGGGGQDKFRINITGSGGGVVYDNNPGGSDEMDDADPQAISGGSIVVHKP
ncbi:MAG: HYR domain-containing protein [Verrucomicrobia bacterium]|nr:HYR domain-containing protein [Verrucomicrobiota bacterium]